MGNRFRGDGRDLKLSNGATDVFLSVLQFPLSDFAADAWERALAQWIAWHDQNVVGIGTVGFDLDEVLWDEAGFPGQKTFLLRAVDAALAGHRWDELCYDPSPVTVALRSYRQLVEAFERPAERRARAYWPWPQPGEEAVRCAAHQVHCYLDEVGCRVCVSCGRS